LKLSLFTFAVSCSTRNPQCKLSRSAGDGLTFAQTGKKTMIEKQTINGRDVWLKVDPYHVNRPNPNVIPTEYFTASFYYEEPAEDAANGEQLKDEDGEPKLFESPVAALTGAWKSIQNRKA
jgi:hypothetical protein